MSKCSFCGIKENQITPVCQSCGALRYPVANAHLATKNSRQDKLKLSASIAVAIVTPGSLLILALVGANHLNTKIKNKK